jgi:hypothetical protein
VKRIQAFALRAGIAAMLFAILAIPLAGRVAASTAASTTLTFSPNADAYVSSAYPSTNYGSAASLRADASPVVRSFLKFSVSGLNGGTITNAKLRFYAKSSSSAGLTAKRVSNTSWGETTITYGNMPSIGTTIQSSSAVTAGTWITIDVSSYVTAAGTYSFALTTPGSSAISMSSREASSNRPKLVVTVGSSSTTNPTPTPAPISGSIQHVFVLWMENKGYSQVWNTSSTPYITSLGNSYIRATAFYAIRHPSLPNYLDFIGGSNYNITTDCNPSSTCHISANNLADTLEARGLTWKAYQESMPSPCYLTGSGNYAPKHNPFVYFDDIRNNSTRCNGKDVNFSVLSTDLAHASTTPNLAFITPNLCNDMHSCSISTGDNWLANHVPAILNSPACTSDKCLLILSWDEDNGNYGNRVLTIFAGSGAKTGGGTSSVHYTHYSALRTVEYIFGLPTLTSNDANASPMTDMLR